MLVNASGTLNLNAMTIVDGLTGAFEDGGGILNKGVLIVTGSTFSGNSADASGGGIANTNTAIISNSTFSGNGAYAIFHSGLSSGTMTVSNSTIADNSGGFVYTYSGATIQNTIIASNGTDCYEPISGSGLTADSSNMDSDGSCDNATTQTATQLNLGSLADNGGETQTIALLAGSTALETGDDALCPATDQRGVARPQGSHCDVGAFELEQMLNTAPTANPGGPYLGAINTNIQFDGSASSDPEADSLTYAWDFGDSTSGTGVMPTHSYSTADTYTVCLTVNDGALDSDPVCTQAVITEPSAGFPATSILDDFNRANGSVGGNWAISNRLFQYKISNQQLNVQFGGALIWKPASFGPSQEAFITLQTIDPRSPTQGLLLKAQSGSQMEAGIIAVVYDARAEAVRVSTVQRIKRKAVWTNYGNTPVTFADGDQLGARVLADGNVEVYQNGALIATVTLNAKDQAFFNGKGGRIGIWAIAPNAMLDDFGGGDVALP